jgi:hypothetical protein
MSASAIQVPTQANQSKTLDRASYYMTVAAREEPLHLLFSPWECTPASDIFPYTNEQGAPGRIRATRQSAVGQLRGAALASSHAPLIAFNTNSGGGSKRNDGPSPKVSLPHLFLDSCPPRFFPRCCFLHVCQVVADISYVCTPPHRMFHAMFVC